MPIPGTTVDDVDGYSDVSNGSTISVGSAASGGSGHMPRPPTAGSRRSKSVQGRRSRVAKSPYSSSQLKGSLKQQPPKPAARNMWITAMRNGTSSLSTENSAMNTWAGPRPYSKQRAGSRTRHMSDYVSIKDLKNKNHVRIASMSASEPQLTGGGPAYKPQEDYYDEIIELKKIINALKEENNAINTKLRRVEGDNILKDRKLEDLLNQRKQPEDMRRTLTDKKGDTSAIVNSLKQKLHAMERSVKDKDTELSQLKKDMKMTNIEELQIQSDTYYQEVQRLQLAVLEMQQAQVNDPPGYSSSPRSSPLSRRSKEKPSTLTLQRIAEENDHLKAENRSLKKDLLTAIENSSGENKKVALKTEYADMNRGQLLAKIYELEDKLQESAGNTILPRKGSLPKEKEADLEVRRKSVAKSAEVSGRIELKGTTSQKLSQLQEREIELVEERDKQRRVIEQLKEDRSHYRSVADDLRLQLKFTQDQLDRLKGEKTAVGERRRSSTSLSRKPSLKDTPPADENGGDLDRMLEEFHQQRAAKTLQRQWRGYQGRRQQQAQQAIQEEEMKRNSAAMTLQKNWRRHRDKTKQVEEESKEEAIKEIQAALRGQAVRSKYIKEIKKDLWDRDDAIVTIQSAMKAHYARKRHLGGPGDELKLRDTRTRGSSSLLLGSEPDSDDGLVNRTFRRGRYSDAAVSSAARRHSLSDSQESTERAREPLEPDKVALDEEFALKEATRDKRYAPAPLSRDQARVSTSNEKSISCDQDFARDKTCDSSSLARHETLPSPLSQKIPRDQVSDTTTLPHDVALSRSKACTVDPNIARDSVRDPSTPARDQSESDSDDDAVVIGRSAGTGNKKREKTRLNLNTSVESNQTTSAVNEKDNDVIVEKTKAYRRGRHSPEEIAKNEKEDSSEERSKADLEGSRRVISAPRFSNISEHSEDEVTNSLPSRSYQNTFGRPLNGSTHKQTEQHRKKKTFEIVDSDDDDDDVAVVTGPKRSLDTGMNQQRPSLSRSNRDITLSGPNKELRPGLSRSSRGISPPPTTEDSVKTVESRPGLSRSSRGISEDNVQTVESRPGLSRSSRGISRPATSDDRTIAVESRSHLSRTSGHLTVHRGVEDSESGREENSPKPEISTSKRPLSGKRPSLTRSGGRDKEKESPRSSNSVHSRMITGSDEDSDEDDAIMTGKKAKTAAGGERAGGRASLKRRSPPGAVSASSQRESLVNSLDNFFSSTTSTKGSSIKKSPRKTHARVQESDHDDDDDDDDIVVSSLSKLSRKGEPSRKDPRDSVADLWATSDRGDSSKRKSSIKSSKRDTWSTDFEFEKPPRRSESQLDELF